jgi:hypothetical protein
VAGCHVTYDGDGVTSLAEAVEAAERDAIATAIRVHGGNISRAARALKMWPPAMREPEATGSLGPEALGYASRRTLVSQMRVFTERE